MDFTSILEGMKEYKEKRETAFLKFIKPFYDEKPEIVIGGFQIHLIITKKYLKMANDLLEIFLLSKNIDEKTRGKIEVLSLFCEDIERDLVHIQNMEEELLKYVVKGKSELQKMSD